MISSPCPGQRFINRLRLMAAALLVTILGSSAHAAASHFKISSEPESLKAGESAVIRVIALDEKEQPVTDDSEKLDMKIGAFGEAVREFRLVMKNGTATSESINFPMAEPYHVIVTAVKDSTRRGIAVVRPNPAPIVAGPHGEVRP